MDDQDPISFEEEISALEDQLEEARAELRALEERWESYQVDIGECRQALDRLRMVHKGVLPVDEADDLPEVAPVEIDPSTGRAPRGARRRQIEQVCRMLGRDGEQFRTIEVLETLEEIQENVSESARAYVYSLMDSLEDADVVEKIGRGIWKLNKS